MQRDFVIAQLKRLIDVSGINDGMFLKCALDKNLSTIPEDKWIDVSPTLIGNSIEEIVLSMHDNYIAAIKEVRQITGMGLKEAKDFVDRVVEANPDVCWCYKGNRGSYKCKLHPSK